MSPVSTMGAVGYFLFWALFATVLGLFIVRMNLLRKLLGMGRKEDRSASAGQRAASTFGHIMAQWCNLKSITRKDLAGLGHALLFWGFCFFLLSYIIFIGLSEGFGLSAFIKGNAFEQVYFYILDFAGIIVLLAVVWATIRRYILKPQRLEANMEAGLILIFVSTLMVLHLVTQGFEYASGDAAGLLPPLSGALAGWFSQAGMSGGTLTVLHNVAWWLHYGLILGFLIYIPRSKHFHILSSPLNVFFRNLGPQSVPLPMDLEKAESFGASRISDFTWKQLLDVYSCAVCGRCHASCPAHLSGKALSPREVVVKLRDYLLHSGPVLLKLMNSPEQNPAPTVKSVIGDIITPEELWDCTTCRACEAECPVLVEHVRTIIEMRRHLAMEKAEFPPTSQVALTSLANRGHPFSGTTLSRTDWTIGLGIKILSPGEQADTLLWVGCTGALDERAKAVSIATAKVLKAAGMDFAILGSEEKCCGDPARRMGDEYNYQTLCQQNIKTFKACGVKRIITFCPHCFNTLKNEYPAFGGTYEVTHHSELIAGLLREGKLKLNGQVSSKLTFHDSCYLGRYNNIYDAPRNILKSVSGNGIAEMERSHARGLCCGGGGGHLWIEEPPGKRVGELRIAEAVMTGADTVATACPYCIIMLEDGLKAKGAEGKMCIKDVSELVAQLLP